METSAGIAERAGDERELAALHEEEERLLKALERAGDERELAALHEEEERLLKALWEADKAYGDARDENTTPAEEQKLADEIDAVIAAFEKRHGLAELRAKVKEANAAVAAFYKKHHSDLGADEDDAD